jgi:hypothetical protein
MEKSMIHYHGTPITPRRVLLELGGKHFCVSFADKRDDLVCHQIGQSVMLDNGAFTFWTTGKPVDWDAYYEWAEPWLDYKTTWAIIPDVINGTEQSNDLLVARCPLPIQQSSPVWHLHEDLTRLDYFLDLGYHRICFGSSGEYRYVGSPQWHRRITQAFNHLTMLGPLPWIHMLRGMALSGEHYPFASVDSTDIARHHHEKNNARAMADRWDALQCPARWVVHAEQEEMEL